MADFDAIVVGAGCAGCVAAYELARAGKSVLLIERGNRAGAKNMTGGRVYSHALKAVFPHFEDEAPIERKISHERISLMAPDSNFTIDFSSYEMLSEGKDSYSVLRAPFDQWLASKAEDAGAECIFGIAVEKLLLDNAHRVFGVSAGGDSITADIVLLCDGVNSLLTAQGVEAAQPAPGEIAVGVKQTIELPETVISDRVLAGSHDEGAAWLFAGDATKGIFGGGFMYTNKTSISLGVITGIEAQAKYGKASICRLLEDLKANPAVAPLIKDGKVVEHSGHMVPEGGINTMPTLVGDGVLVAGDSAMMCINLGYQVRGMDYAIAAGMHAGREAAKAIDAGDTSKAGLQGYVRALKDSFVLKDLEKFQKVPAFMGHFNRMFCGYPEMLRDIMNGMFIVNGAPAEPIKGTIMQAAKQVGFSNLLKDMRGAMKAL